MSAPERIWAYIEEDDQGTFIEFLSSEPLPPAEATREDEVGYVRADLHDTLRAERDALAARVERLEGALRQIAGSAAYPSPGIDYTTGEGHAECLAIARTALAETQEE